MLRLSVWIISLATCASAHAALIEFETEALFGQRFRTTYTVTNDSSSAPLRLFDIGFDTALYDELSLSPVSSAAITGAWSEIILHSAPGMPAFYDVFALDAGIAPGAALSGFAIEFDWLGVLADARGASQPFLVYDATTFELLESGMTRAAKVLAVPEPGTPALIGVGLIVLVARRIRSLVRHW